MARLKAQETSMTKAEEREALIEKMPPALREKLDFMLEWLADDRRHTLVNRWELGRELRDIVDAESSSNSKRFGIAALKKLEKFIDDDPSILHVAERIARYWTRSEIAAMAETPMADGVSYISYSHVRALSALPDEGDRDFFLKEAIKNSWTAVELGKAIIDKYGNKSRNPNGRAGLPKNAEAIITQQLGFVEDFENRNIKVWKDPQRSLSAQLAKVSPTAYTDELAKKLGVLAKRMRQMATEANARATEAEQKFNEITQIMNEKHKPIATPAEIVENEETTEVIQEAPPVQPKRSALRGY